MPGITSALNALLLSWQRRKSNSSQHKRRRIAFESLESRLALAADPAFAHIDNQSVLGGAPLWLGIDGSDSDGGELTYTVSVSNPALLQATISPKANSSLKMEVAGYGQMIFQLFDHLAPKTTEHIKALVDQGDFSNSASLPVKWYRIAHYSNNSENTDFVIQGGPDGGSSSLGPFDDEYNLDLQFTSSGLLAMAKSNDDTNDATIFVSGSPARFLDFNYSIFGILTEGESIRQAIQNARLTGDGPPPSDIFITSSTIVADSENAALMLKAAEGASGQADVTVTVTDARGNAYSQTFHVTVSPDTSNSAPFFANLPATIQGPADAPLTLQLQAIDAENNANFFDATKPSNETVPYTLNVNNTTGLVTITPPAGFTGTFRVLVGVRGAEQATTADQFDIQVIEVVIGEPAFSVDLLPESDTGSSSTDNITNASTLQFRVGGVTDGALVKLQLGSTILAQGTASGNSITLSTTQFTGVGEALLQITATQTIDGVESDPTPPLSLTFDSLAPQFTSTPPTIASVGVPVTYNAHTNEEVLPGLRYSLIGPLGGIIDPLTGVFSWTPSTAQTGLQVFVITATDAAGNQSSQQLSFSVTTLLNSPPVAVNDTAFAYADFPSVTIISVLANDTTAPDVGENLTILSVSAPASGGIALIGDDDTHIHYRPGLGFTGTDTFTYTITDGRGGTATATVTVTVQAGPAAKPRVGLILQLTTPEGLPLATLSPGQGFVLHVLAQDQSVNPHGVFAAYLDVAWDNTLAEVTGPIEFSGTYPNGRNGNTSTPGMIDEAGALAGITELGNGMFEVFSVPMRATTAGALVFTSDPADQIIFHDVLVYGLNDPVPTASIHYGTASVIVETQPLADALDVDDDGQIAPSDALMVINALSSQLALGVQDGSLPNAPNSNRLDVSGDGLLAPIDALLIINHLNLPRLELTSDPLITLTSPTFTSSAEGEGGSADALSDPDLLALAADEACLELTAPSHLRPRR